MPPTHRPRRAVALITSGALLTAGGLAALGGPLGAAASSHREAPAIAGQPQYDTTDVYAFVSPDRPDSVTLIANWIPFEEPAGGPNFYPFADDARYEIMVDNNGDAKPDITYRWTFSTSIKNGDTFLYNTGAVTSLGDPDLNVSQSYKLQVIEGGTTKAIINGGKVAPSNVGKASMPNYNTLRQQAITTVGTGKAAIKSFAGQADDSFFLDLRVFDLLYGGDLSEVGDDTLAGFNVNTIALQVPTSKVTAKDSVIGVWSETSRKDSSGRYRSVSRLGMPLVNEVVIPLKDKDKFNASQPSGDAQFLEYVTKPGLPRVIEAVYGIKAPKEPRNDLVSVFLTGVDGLNQPKNVVGAEMLRLNTAIAPVSKPKRLGVLEGDTAGFPNGRRLTDDVVDIALQVVEGELVGSPNDLGDAVNANDKNFESSFPYVALPHSGSDDDVHEGVAGFTPLTGGNAPTSTNGGFSIPVVPASTALLGLLAMTAGAIVIRRSRPVLVSA